MATFQSPAHLETQWNAACKVAAADQLWLILQQASAQTATLAEALTSSDTTAGFRLACRKGHLKLVRELLGLTGVLAVDVHAADERGPEAAFRWACGMGHTDIVCELLSLDGHRRIPDTERSRASSFPSLAELI